MLTKNDLGDVQDIPRARRHLGIGNLALQDSNNVNITDGVVSVSNLQIKRGYDFVYGDMNTNGYFFVSDSNDTSISPIATFLSEHGEGVLSLSIPSIYMHIDTVHDFTAYMCNFMGTCMTEEFSVYVSEPALS